MKTITMNKIKPLFIYYSLSILQFCHGAEFRNLGFDEADLSGLRKAGPADSKVVLSGWNLLRGGEPYQIVYVNQDLPGNWDYDELGDYHHLGFAEGKYALFFRRQDLDSPLWSIEQTGTVPVGAKYLTFRCIGYEMQVQINDEIIPRLDWRLPPFDWQVPEQGPNVVYDISAYAGQEVKLALVGPYGPCGVFNCIKDTYIDSLLFLEDVPKINTVVEKMPSTTTNIVTLTFKPIPGRFMDVQYRDDMSQSNTWTYLPISPATPGMVIDKTPADHRIYRLKISVPWQGLP